MEPRLSHPARLADAALLRLQSDARLTALARAGHDAAFEVIVQRYRPPLLRYCTRLLGPERAEDAVQQALANAHAAMTSRDDRSLELRPWLYRVAHNAALNLLRARHDEAQLSDDAAAGDESPHEVVARRERLDAVLAAIAALPPGQRDAILLRELEGRSHEEIADVLGVSAGAARQQLFRARAAVRAACTALTPTPFLVRLMEAGTAAGPGGGDIAAGTLTKAMAGVLATGALVGGAATTTGIVHRSRADAGAGAAQAQPPHESRAPAPGPAAAAPLMAAAFPAAGRGTPSRSGSGDDHGRRGRDDHGGGVSGRGGDDHGGGVSGDGGDDHGGGVSGRGGDDHGGDVSGDHGDGVSGHGGDDHRSGVSGRGDDDHQGGSSGRDDAHRATRDGRDLASRGTEREHSRNRSGSHGGNDGRGSGGHAGADDQADVSAGGHDKTGGSEAGSDSLESGRERDAIPSAVDPEHPESDDSHGGLPGSVPHD